MANSTSYLVILLIFAFNLGTVATNELDVWGSSDMQSESTNMDNISASITDLTDTSGLVSEDDVSIDYFQLPGLVLKSLGLLVLCFAAIPFAGALVYAYGMPLAIAAIIEGMNLILVAFAIIEFASNRSAKR